MVKDPEHAMTKTKLEKIVYSFHHPRSMSGGRSIRSRESLTDYIARYTREVENGTRLNIHKLRYGTSTIKNYKGFIIQFDEFCKAKRNRFDFGDIDLKFYVLTADVENIYLTESEIRAIAVLDLSNNKYKDIARDVFL